MTAPLARSPPPSPAAAGRGPAREPPAVRRDRWIRGETGTLCAARAFAPALPGCGRQRARTGGPACHRLHSALDSNTMSQHKTAPPPAPRRHMAGSGVGVQ